MTFRGLLILALLTSLGQDAEIKHAPTVAQCQADQRLWLSRIEENGVTAHPSYPTLVDWAAEMYDCESVDPGNKVKYYNTIWEISTLRQMRLEHFVVRHDLYPQFVKEDAEGKR